jgi:hypothetical protein
LWLLLLRCCCCCGAAAAAVLLLLLVLLPWRWRRWSDPAVIRRRCSVRRAVICLKACKRIPKGDLLAHARMHRGAGENGVLLRPVVAAAVGPRVETQ